MINKSTKLVQNQEWVIVVALSLLVTLLRLPSLEQPFDNDGGATAYHARLIVRGEPLYGTHHPAHHLPAVYYAYALAFLLFGDSVWAIKFLLILWTIVTVYLLYRLGALMADKATGALAAAFYSILTSHIYMWGTTAQIELFANLPHIATLLVLMDLMTRRTVAWKFVFAGLLSAFTFLFKAVYLLPLAIAGLVLLIELWQTRATADAWRAILMRGLWLGVGFIVGLLPVVAYFGILGLLPRLLLVLTLGLGYVNGSAAPLHLQDRLLFPLFGLAINNAALLIFSLAGLLMIALNELRKYHSKRHARPTTLFYVAVWYILSFIEASIARIPFLHYYLLIVPPLALLAAWLLLKIYHDVQNQVRTANRFIAPLILIVLLTITLSISIGQNFNYYYHYVRYKLGLETHQDFLLDGWPIAGLELVRVQELADYVKGHTAPTDHIYCWSMYPQIYYLADRRCPIDVIWPYYVEATGSYQRIFAPQTKYVIVDDSNDSPAPDWLYTELAKKYTLETVIKDQKVYRRVD